MSEKKEEKVVFIISLLEKKDAKLKHEREMRSKLLIQQESLNLCLEFYYPKEDLLKVKLWVLMKKRKPHVVLFHECCPKTIHDHHEVIVKKSKEKITFFHNGTTGKLNKEIEKELLLTDSVSKLPLYLSVG